MQARVWIYMFKQAFRSLIENKIVNLISISTMTISLLIFSLFQLVSVNLYHWIEDWGESGSMSVYLEEGVDKRAMERIKASLGDLPGVKIKKYISKDEAMKHLSRALNAHRGLLDGLDDNPLPASYEIVFSGKGKKQIGLAEIKKKLEQIDGVDEVQYNEQWVEYFEGIITILRISGMIIGGMLCLAVLFIITNTIKLNIYSRKEEIEIYKLVGATDWFIKIPYLIEGGIQGAISGIITIILILLIYSVATAKTIQILGLPMLEVIFLSQVQLTVLIGLSVFLGLSGAFIAIGRFIRLTS
jgi:cell division transport system permease protein